MEEREQSLTEALQAHFSLSQEQEDRLWESFQARREQSLAWAAFGAAMVLLNLRLQPAQRASRWLFQSNFGSIG